ncbi:hypothetical protein BDR03DRAFT_1011868 [Suillus americanus]|nr:hypothetical protein BDR03DRAFT_1011868 [Suillus americanus]
MLDAVDHFEDYNAHTAAGAHPLTSHLAHNLPHDPDLHAMQREPERAFNEMQEEENGADIHGDGPDARCQTKRGFQRAVKTPVIKYPYLVLSDQIKSMLTTPSACKNFVKEHATRYTQLSHLPYFNLVEQIVIDPMHNLFLGLVKTHFYNIWVQSKILRPNHELDVLHEMLADFVVPGSCGKLPTDIGMPSGGSLTADQWLLLSTVYGPVIVPQLWSACLPSHADEELLNQQVALITQMEAEKVLQATLKMDEKNALAKAKKKGKEAYAAEKARIMNEKAAAKQAEKARLSAEKKAQATQRKSTKRKAGSQVVEDLPEGQVQPPPPPPACQRTTILDKVPPQPDDMDLKFSLHPDDPGNFLKLCAALRILVQHHLNDQQVDTVEQLIREYGAELIKV